MSINLEFVDLIAGIATAVQAIMFLPAVCRLAKDKSISGMSIKSIGYYAGLSWFWVWYLWLLEMTWTMLAVASVALVETIWTIYAIKLVYFSDNKNWWARRISKSRHLG